jgi:hypothetical protein
MELREFNIDHVVPLCSPRNEGKRADCLLRGLRRRLEHFILWLATFAHGSLRSNFYEKRKKRAGSRLTTSGGVAHPAVQPDRCHQQVGRKPAAWTSDRCQLTRHGLRDERIVANSLIETRIPPVCACVTPQFRAPQNSAAAKQLSSRRPMSD